MNEEKAKGKRGFLLYSPYTKKHFFRVYESADKRQFTDYDLCAEDIGVEILDEFTALFKTEDGRNRLDYNSRVRGLKE